VKVEVQEASSTKRELKIEIPASEVDAKLKSELAELQRDLKMPGFRKGRVPEDLVRKRFEGSVRREVMERLVRESCLDAFRQHDLKPIAPPEIRDLKFDDGQSLTFAATVEIWPEISLKRWRGLKAKREVLPVRDEDIQGRLEMLREMQAELVPVDRVAALGDFLLLDYDVFDDRDQPLEGRGVRNHLIELGSENLMKEFSEGLVGTKAGESRTLRVAFPTEGVHEEVAGKTLKFWVKLNAVKEKRLPELNDDFAKDLGNFDRLEDVKGEIRSGLQQEAEIDADRRAREALVDQLIRENPFEAPESMVANLLEAIVEDAEKRHRDAAPFDREKARAALRPAAVRHSKRFAVLREVGRLESLTVTPEDIDARIRHLAGQTRQSPEDVRRKIEEDDSMNQLVEDLLEEKALKSLMDSADIEGVGGDAKESTQSDSSV